MAVHYGARQCETEHFVPAHWIIAHLLFVISPHLSGGTWKGFSFRATQFVNETENVIYATVIFNLSFFSYLSFLWWYFDIMKIEWNKMNSCFVLFTFVIFYTLNWLLTCRSYFIILSRCMPCTMEAWWNFLVTPRYFSNSFLLIVSSMRASTKFARNDSAYCWQNIYFMVISHQLQNYFYLKICLVFSLVIRNILNHKVSWKLLSAISYLWESQIRQPLSSDPGVRQLPYAGVPDEVGPAALLDGQTQLLAVHGLRDAQPHLQVRVGQLEQNLPIQSTDLEPTRTQYLTLNARLSLYYIHPYRMFLMNLS